MSQQVTIDFEGVSTKIQIQCDLALNSLCKIDKAIANIKRNANKVETTKLKKFEDFLLKSKNEIQLEINELTKKLDQYKELKKVVIIDSANNSDSNKSLLEKWNELNKSIKVQSDNLVKLVSELTGSKLVVINQLVNDGLLESIGNAKQAMEDKVNGVISNNELLNKINSIDDCTLRELAYQQMIQGVEDYNLILIEARKMYDKLLNKSAFVEEIKEEMKTSGVTTEEIEKIIHHDINSMTLDEMNNKATQAIANEKIRKETLKVIIKVIKSRGFIVDTKNNLKFDRTRNIVKLLALKPDGKYAEFEISLNGKFMYRFEGYVGQACNKDITPFIEDLKNIYDINILHEEIQWSNPDKVQSQRYHYMNTNKGKK